MPRWIPRPIYQFAENFRVHWQVFQEFRNSVQQKLQEIHDEQTYHLRREQDQGEDYTQIYGDLNVEQTLTAQDISSPPISQLQQGVQTLEEQIQETQMLAIALQKKPPPAVSPVRFTQKTDELQQQISSNDNEITALQNRSTTLEQNLTTKENALQSQISSNDNEITALQNRSTTLEQEIEDAKILAIALQKKPPPAVSPVRFTQKTDQLAQQIINLEKSINQPLSLNLTSPSPQIHKLYSQFINYSVQKINNENICIVEIDQLVINTNVHTDWLGLNMGYQKTINMNTNHKFEFSGLPFIVTEVVFFSDFDNLFDIPVGDKKIILKKLHSNQIPNGVVRYDKNGKSYYVQDPKEWSILYSAIEKNYRINLSSTNTFIIKGYKFIYKF